ncbi:MAG: copper amine oxidase N-terminal domain-containing protein [Candidatus Eremiobacteraeota bacterium]|nr:copper amine oxidase N-terminal domain-containing protein [Candidatus Eremiobacteraeota bacterium]MBC5822339.1 copper amine oxidase N-terminal domain-containing protein [Candidatus Eremiobacteraeota bacterium]
MTAPLDPYARAFATMVAAGKGGRITFERNGRTFVILLGSRDAFAGAAAVTLPIAPYLRAGEPIIPLAAVARALGFVVTYDGAARRLDIETESMPSLSTPTPFVTWSPAPGERPTFTPHAAPTPVPTISGIPHPRRTPILVPPDGTLR